MEDSVIEHPDSREQEFEQSLEQLERSLLALRERQAMLQTTQAEYDSLQQHRQEVEIRWQKTQLPELEQEFYLLDEQLKALTVTMESRLLSDSQLQELFWQGLRQGILGDLFWQILRFGGLGVVLGWLLKAWTS